MDIIIGGRGFGKTKRCIELAAESGAYIVCASRAMVDQVWKMVMEMDLLDKVPFPITFEDVVTGQFGSGCKKLIYDDVDLILHQISRGVEVEAITLTDEDMGTMNGRVEGDCVIIGDDPVADINHKLSDEDKEKMKNFYDKVVVPGMEAARKKGVPDPSNR